MPVRRSRRIKSAILTRRSSSSSAMTFDRPPVSAAPGEMMAEPVAEIIGGHVEPERRHRGRADVERMQVRARRDALRLPAIGEPEILVAATVEALVDMKAVDELALRGDHHAVDGVRRAVREIDVV